MSDVCTLKHVMFVMWTNFNHNICLFKHIIDNFEVCLPPYVNLFIYDTYAQNTIVFSVYKYIRHNYMFRPYVLAIIRLSLNLTSNYTKARGSGGVGRLGEEISSPNTPPHTEPSALVWLLVKFKDNLMMANT